MMLLAFLAGLTGLVGAQTLSEQEQRGKQIFVAGESVAGRPITAVVSRGATPIPASILPCGGCHGEDGRGRPEGGVVPPDITWRSLTAEQGHEHEYGRSHLAFDRTSVAAAIVRGIDPAGNVLDVAMPRYRISEEDMVDLIAYLQRIDDDLDSGLTEDTITVGSLLPVEGRLGPAGRAMRQVLEAVFENVNESGGIHGRRIELVVSEYGEDPLESVWRTRDLLQRDSVFALVGSYAVGIEAELAAAAEELEVPMIGPFTQLPRAGKNGERHSFYLAGGLIEQAAVLARHVSTSGRGAARRMAIVHPTARVFNAVVTAAQAQLAARGAPEAETLSYTQPLFDPVATTDALVEWGSDTVLFIGPAAELKRLGEAVLARGLAPTLLLPGLFASEAMFELDASFRGRVLVGYSSVPADHSPEGVREFEALHAEHDFGYEHSTAQISAYVAAKVLTEGLKRAGRRLSREKLLASLESLSEFHPGLMPPLSYGRKYRIGAYGGYVTELDLEKKGFAATSDWVSLRF